MTFRTYSTLFFLLIVSLGESRLSAQGLTTRTETNGSRPNSVRTAVPFLLITPDARAGGMGETGAAVSPDANAVFSNPSKLAFLEQDYGFSLSYSPWLRHIASDINLGYLSGFYKIDDHSTVAGSMRYFSFGKIQLTDVNQQDLGTYSPSELAVDLSYARRFGETFSLGTTVRYINSNLNSGQFNTGQNNRAAQALAVDVSAFFKKPAYLLGYDVILAGGLHLSNIGTKIRYSDAGLSDFLPANLKIGGASTFILDNDNELTVAVDFNKLLVPTQPIYNTDGTIFSGRDPDRSVPAGLFGSFTDAPGGFSEEMQEISISSGLEYWYRKRFALRTGYFYENPRKGDRRYMTLGMGVKYDVFNLDLSYLLANTQKSPLANTLKFTLLFNFGEIE